MKKVSSKELAPLQLSSLLDPNMAASTELSSLPPRFVVYGTHISGASELADLIAAGLEAKGIGSDEVIYSRDVDNIENAFFDRGRTTKPEILPTENNPTHISPLAKITKRLGGSTLRAIEPASSSGIAVPTPATEETAISLPTAVFVLPEMRQYSELGGMTIDTPVEHIERLCSQHGIPMIRVERTSGLAEITQGINEITA